MPAPLYLVVLNIGLFAGLAGRAYVLARRSSSVSIAFLWRLAMFPAVVVVIGGIQRLGIQAVRAGWLPEHSLDFLLDSWQIIQSLTVTAIGVITFIGLGRVARRLNQVETVVGDMVDRVSDLDLDVLGLTPRERDVLGVIGESTHIDDRTLSEKLGVSADTAHSHVTSLLKKTKLRDRRDLMVVAFLHKGR